jgi:hypothetical protein
MGRLGRFLEQYIYLAYRPSGYNAGMRIVFLFLVAFTIFCALASISLWQRWNMGGDREIENLAVALAVVWFLYLFFDRLIKRERQKSERQ